MLNKDRDYHSFGTGQSMYVHLSGGAHLQTGRRKMACNFVGPLIIFRTISPTQLTIMTLDVVIFPHIVEDGRIKPGFVRTS